MYLEENLFTTRKQKAGRMSMQEFIKYMGTLNSLVDIFCRLLLSFKALK